MEDEQLEQQFDQVLALIPMAKEAEVLEQIATSLDLDLTQLAGNKRGLQRILITHLNSEAFDGHTERGKLILSARDTLRQHLGFEPEDNPLERDDRVAVKKDDDSDAASSEDSEDESEEEEKKVSAEKPKKQAGAMAAWPASIRLKDFKFSGQIGDKGEKGKLTYTGVMHQIDTGLQLGYDEQEICLAVVRAITPGNTLRIYFEGPRKLTIKKLKSTLKAYFCEKEDVTSVYNEMTGAVQGSGEKDTPLTFVVHMFSLRDRIVELSRRKSSHGQKYSRKLVKSEMQKSIYAGLKDESIRQDLKQTLKKKNLDDDELMEELTAAIISKDEHEKRLQEAARKRKTAQVSVLTTEDSDSSLSTGTKASNGKTAKAKSNQTNQKSQNNNNVDTNMPSSMDPFLAQLSNVISTQIRDAVVPLQAQINELVGCQMEQRERKPITPLTATAPVFNPQPKLGAAAAGTVEDKAQGPHHGNGSSTGQKGNPVEGGNGDWQQTLCNFLDSYNAQGNSGNRGGRHPRFNNGNSLKKCSICRAANAVSCNHCLVCHGVDHRTYTCPKRSDPNYVPKN